MSLGILGKKIGMSRIFTEDGQSIPITVIQAPVNRVAQVKTVESDGYTALQMAAYVCDPKRLSKASAGHLKKMDADKAYSYLKEFRVNDPEVKAVGDTLDVGIFEPGQKVKVIGINKGKGFAGTIKRHNFKGQDRSHGNSISHRVAGSTGQCQTPGKVFKGKKMAGRMGGKQTTLINLEVVLVDREKSLLLLKGSVPGAPQSRVAVEHMQHVDLSAIEQKNAKLAEGKEQSGDSPQQQPDAAVARENSVVPEQAVDDESGGNSPEQADDKSADEERGNAD